MMRQGLPVRPSTPANVAALINIVHAHNTGANSAVRFTTYTTLKQAVQSQQRPGQPVSSLTTFGIGAVAGLVTVYTTMPLE